MHPKDEEGIANSVDPEQYDLGLHCLPRPVCPKTSKQYGYLLSKVGVYADHMLIAISINDRASNFDRTEQNIT